MTQQPNNSTTQQPASRLAKIELSLIRQINALATPLSTNLGIGEPNVEPDETLREFARRAATTSWHYSANAGHVSLRRKLGDPNEVCITAGTQEALYAIFQAYVDPGDEVLVPDPGFVSYAALAKICGAEPVPYPLEAPSWKLDARAVTSRITSKTKLIIVNSPSNPLGAVADADAMRELANAGPLVISDEIYRQLWYDAEPPSMRGMSDRVIVIDGMSKSHAMTGLRIAWTIAHPDVLKAIITAHQYIATCASVFSQALAEMVFDAPDWNASWLARVRAQFRDQREVALHAIAHELDVQLAPPPAAFYAFVPVPSCDTLTFAKTLATDAAVLVIPGAAFGINGEGFVRISYAASHDALGTGIERIDSWLRANGR